MLGTSGIRGVYGEKIKGSSVYEWVNKFAQEFDYIYIGRDLRESSLPLAKAASAGALSAGVDVYDLGIVSTGIMGFAGVGIMITASHNPLNHNGVKFIKEKRELMKTEAGFLTEPLYEAGAGHYYQEEIFSDYLDALEVFEFSFEGRVFEVNSAVQTFFTWYAKESTERFSLINNVPKMVRESEPSKLSLEEGFAYDADGDRVVLFKDGKPISGDLLFAMVARYMAEQKGKKTLVATVELPKYLLNYLKQFYPHIRIVPVGSTFVGYELMKYKDSFGGEPNGEYIFPEISYVPDGIASTALLTEMESQGMLELPHIKPYPVERSNYPTTQKHQVMEKLKSLIQEDFSDIDGILIEKEDYKVLIRPSGTEDLIRLTIEASTPQLLKEIKEKYEKLILPLL
ncbi:MAG: hypothetical protein GXN92_02175 [Candidatus Micrarchaeota archaeon]|nr:hypothetical protein [Candidatus Micrarchaeota archaeon]